MTKEQALDTVEKAIDLAYDKGRNQRIDDLFSFAKFFNENFEYFDNTNVGDVYKYKGDSDGLYSQEDIFDEWINNRQ